MERRSTEAKAMSSSPDDKRNTNDDGDDGGGDGPPPVTVEMESPAAGGLKKSLSLLSCTALMVAVTGHSAIFISQAAILSAVGSVGATLLVWFVGGLLNMAMALCFTEMGTMIPKAGGPYAFVLATFGPLAGFLTMWGYVVLVAAPFWAFLAYTAALYLVLPAFQCPPSPPVETAIKVLAAWILISLLALNCVYVRVVTRIQTFLTASKMVALVIIIVGGLYHLATGATEHFESPFEGTTQEPGQWAMGIFYSLFSYAGWQIIVSLTEEVKNPGRDLPRSVVLTFVVVIAQYILANVAYLALLSPSAMLQSDAVALLFTERLYPPLSVPMAIMVTTTTIGALNASIMGHSRLLFAAARVGHMPAVLGMVHAKYCTPCPAITTLGVLSLLLLWVVGMKDMMEFAAVFATLIAVAVILSLLYLRYTQPHFPRPYRTMTAVPVSQLVISCVALVLAVYQRPGRVATGLLVLLLGVALYCVGVLWTSKPARLTTSMDKLTLWAQKTFQLVMSK